MNGCISSTKMNRRTFLQLTAHLSAFVMTVVIQPTATRMVSLAVQPNGYGTGAYGQGVYAGASGSGEAAAAKHETLEHTFYLPIINKEEN